MILTIIGLIIAGILILTLLIIMYKIDKAMGICAAMASIVMMLIGLVGSMIK